MDDLQYLEYLKSTPVDLKIVKYKACPLIGGMLISFLDNKKRYATYLIQDWKRILSELMHELDNAMYPDGYFEESDIDVLFDKLVSGINIIGDVATLVVAKSILAKEIDFQNRSRVMEIVNLEHQIKQNKLLQI